VRGNIYTGEKGWLEYFTALYEPGYLWDVKDGLIEEFERKVDKVRGIKSSYEVLRVIAVTLKRKRSKGRKDGTCQRSRTSVCLMFGEGAAVSEDNMDGLKLC
jgi:hypothetical protein